MNVLLVMQALRPSRLLDRRFAARRSLGGRFWSVVDVLKRLDRTRGGFHLAAGQRLSGASRVSSWAATLTYLVSADDYGEF